MSHFKPLAPKKGKLFAVHPIARVVIGIVAVFLLSLGAKMIVSRTAHFILPAYSDSTAHLFTSRKALTSKITELQTTLASYEARLGELAVLEDENAKLKAELGRAPSEKGVLAHVLTTPNKSFYATFIIDAGVRDGIAVGQTAYAFNSIALGTVVSVENSYATVELFSASGKETSGTAEASEVAVTLIGRGGGEYEVRMPRNIPFDIGSMITMQSVHTAILAQVEKVVTDPRDPFQRLLAKAPVNLQALKWVLIR